MSYDESIDHIGRDKIDLSVKGEVLLPVHTDVNPVWANDIEIISLASEDNNLMFEGVEFEVSHTERFEKAMKMLSSYGPIFNTHVNQELIAAKCTTSALFQQLNRVFELFDLEFKVALAKQTTGDFAIPQNLVDDDVALYRSLGSIEAVAKFYHDKSRHEHINVESVNKWVPKDDPERGLVMDFVSEG